MEGKVMESPLKKVEAPTTNRKNRDGGLEEVESPLKIMQALTTIGRRRRLTRNSGAIFDFLHFIPQNVGFPPEFPHFNVNFLHGASNFGE